MRKSDVRGIKEALAHLEGLIDPEGLSERAGRVICGCPLEKGHTSKLYIQTWIMEPLQTILDYEEGRISRYEYERSANYWQASP